MPSRSSSLLVVLALALCACDHTQLISFAVDAPLACTEGRFTAVRRTPAVMFVLDRSGSMGEALGTGSRWTTLTAALGQTLKVLGDDVEVGAYLYPAGETGAAQCTVPGDAALLPAPGQTAALAALLARSSPGGATPTADALVAASQQLAASVPSAHGHALVLATDGAPNCNPGLNAASCTCLDARSCTTPLRCLDDGRTVGRVAALAASGVPTWVIGVATDAVTSQVLDALARAGGRPRAGAHAFTSVTSAQELTQAFVDIQTQLRACTFVTTSVPDAAGSAELRLDGVVVPFDPSGVEGWTWSSLERGELALRGTACARASVSAQPVVELNVRCGGVDAGAEPLE